MGQETNSVICESCYGKNDEGAIFCHKCGDELITEKERERIKKLRELELNIMNSKQFGKMVEELKYHWYDSVSWAFLFSLAAMLTIIVLFLVFVSVIA